MIIILVLAAWRPNESYAKRDVVTGEVGKQ